VTTLLPNISTPAKALESQIIWEEMKEKLHARMENVFLISAAEKPHYIEVRSEKYLCLFFTSLF